MTALIKLDDALAAVNDWHQITHIRAALEAVPLVTGTTDRIKELEKERVQEAVRLRAASAVRVGGLTKKLDNAEAKLAKAVEALRELDRRNDSLDTFDNAVHEIVSAALAELEGEG